jgi:hypothetical protein
MLSVFVVKDERVCLSAAKRLGLGMSPKSDHGRTRTCSLCLRRATLYH